MPAAEQPVHPGLFTASGLLGGRCGGCGKRHFPVAVPCPWCGSDDVETCYAAADLNAWAARFGAHAAAGREVFAFFISAGKVRAPAGAVALAARIDNA